MALKKRKKSKPKLAEDPKVQAVKAAVHSRAADLGFEAGRSAVDTSDIPEVGERFFKKARVTLPGPSKTQVCDAIRAGQPGLPFAAVDRIAAEVMKLYGR